jgi:hypothetical protein
MKEGFRLDQVNDHGLKLGWVTGIEKELSLGP